MRRGTAAALALAALLVGGVGVTVARLVASPPPPRAIAARPRPSPPPAATAGPASTTAPTARLTIAAMRARSYPASTFTLVRADGEQGGFVNEVVSFVSDGLVEDALMSIPDRARPAAGWPVIIINHGYIPPATYVTDDGSYAEFIATYARAGYLVLKPDYRGHGHSQGVAEGGHLSPVYAWDLLNLISTVKADPRMDATRIGLFGHSMGGDEVLRALVVSHDVRAAVFMAGVVGSFNDLFFNWPHPPMPTDSASAVQQQVGSAVVATEGTPMTDAAFWVSASAINYVTFTTAAIQVNHDVADSEVPELFSDHLVSALKAAGKAVQYLTYPGDDHQFIANRAAILRNTLQFFRTNL